MAMSTSGGSDIYSIIPISGARTITLSATGSTPTIQAFKADKVTSKTLNYNSSNDVTGYAYIYCSISFNMSFGREGSVIVDDIS